MSRSAPLLPVETFKGKGCTNWDKIRLGQALRNLTEDECIAKCANTRGCWQANYQTMDCESGRGVEHKACYLFGQGCQKESNRCFDLHTAPARPSHELVGLRTGCGNWDVIKVDLLRNTTDNWCAQECLKKGDACDTFNFQATECKGEQVAQGACYLFKKENKSTSCLQEAAPCWTLYRPVREEDIGDVTSVSEAAPEGSSTLQVMAAFPFKRGDLVSLMHSDKSRERLKVVSIDSGDQQDWVTIEVEPNLKYKCEGGEILFVDLGAGGGHGDQDAFDCDDGLAKWETVWSEDKKAWCCAKENKGCQADPDEAAAEWVKSITGPCVRAGSCVRSPNFPDKYNNDKSCTITIIPSVQVLLNSTSFHTEQGYDFLYVNGQRYSGTSGPSGVKPTRDVEWKPDDNGNAAGGWELCAQLGDSTTATPLTTTEPPPTSPAPAMPTTPTAAAEADDFKCEVGRYTCASLLPGSFSEELEVAVGCLNEPGCNAYIWIYSEDVGAGHLCAESTFDTSEAASPDTKVCRKTTAPRPETEGVTLTELHAD